MREFLVLTVVYCSLPACVLRPFVGLIVFSWLAYMRPQDLAWGISSQRLSLYVAVCTLAGVALAVVQGREKLLAAKPQTYLLIALAVWMSIASLTAVVPELSIERLKLFWKVILIGLLTTGVVRTYPRFRTMVFVIIFSLGLLAVKYGFYGLRHGGTRFDRGPGGFIGDNNDFALALNMVIPLLLGVALAERQRWLRIAGVICAVLACLTVLFTFSRGGLLTLVVVGALLIMRMRHPLLAALCFALAIGSFVLVSSEGVKRSYISRVQTIDDFEEDASAMGRIREWKVGLQIFSDYPLHGVGPNNLRVVRPRYSDIPHRYKVSHNTYIQFLVDGGAPALALFLTLIAVSGWRLGRLRRSATESWVEVYAAMLQISLAAFLVGAVFLDRAYFDLTYHLIALSVSLELAAALEQTKRTGQRSRTPWWSEAATSGSEIG